MGMYLVNDGTAADFETEASFPDGSWEAGWEAEDLALPLAIEPIETQLASADELALEEGIATVFDSLRASDVSYIPPEDELDEVEPTLALLDELNRLWAQPLAA